MSRRLRVAGLPQVDCRWPAPPTRVKLAGGDVHLWCAELDLPEATLARLAASLSPDERERTEGFREGPLRNRFIAGRAILRSILADYLAAEEKRLPVPLFVYGQRGKPRLAEPWASGGLRFNLSHSHGLALVAVAAGRDVGVDVEWLRPVAHIEALVARCFSAAERRQWAVLPDDGRLPAFFRGWTCKEAWLKATGAGLSFPLDQVSVSLDPRQPPRLLSISGDAEDARQWQIASVEPAAGWIAAFAVRGEPPQTAVWRWEPSGQ